MQNRQAHLPRISSRRGAPGTVCHWLALVCLSLVPGYLGAQSSMRIENVTWVANTGTGSAAELANCQALRDALASLPPFSSPRQLVVLASGRYACHTPVVVPPEVTLEGSGVNTVIHGGIDDSSTGLVALTDGAILSKVFVWNTTSAPTQAAIAVSVVSAIGGLNGRVTLIDVTATASGAGSGTRHPPLCRRPQRRGAPRILQRRNHPPDRLVSFHSLPRAF